MKLTLLKPALSVLISCMTLSVWAQPTTSATTPPDYAASKLISLYSDAYTQNVGWNFGDWGSGTTYVQEQINSDHIAKFTTTNSGYFGWEFTSDVNAATMTNLHLDVWIAENTTFQLFPICRTQPNGEKFLEVTAQAGVWTSVDLNLEDYQNQGLDLSGIFQFKFANLGNKVIYIDNVYFYNSSTEVDTEKPQVLTASLVSTSYFSAVIACSATDNSGAVNFEIKDEANGITQTGGAVSGATTNITVNGLQPAIAYNFVVSASDADGNICETTVSVPVTTLSLPTSAAIPQHAATDVISIFSDAYTPATSFAIGNWGQTTVTTKIKLAEGDEAYLMEKFNYLGWELNNNVVAFDASNMNYLHIDIYTPNATSFKITPIWDNGNESQQDCTPLTTNKWNSFDIPLNNFTDINLTNIYQIKMVTESTGTTVFVDNVYFWKEEQTATISATTSNPQSMRLTAGEKQLNISLAAQENIQVFNMLGICLYNATTQNATIQVPAGAYIVKAGNNIQKITVQ